MKLSDYVATFLKDIGLKDAFCISGGASLHLIHSFVDAEINCVCGQHEQACAMAADGYARASKDIGVAISTSGPGATNLVTGIAGAYYDSIPCLFITGQVATFRSKGNTGVRQTGFQETDIIDICKSITKYTTSIKDPSHIKHELQKAIHIAKKGRPGPVLIDIPDDIQRQEVDPTNLLSFHPDSIKLPSIKSDIDRCIEKINNCKRPVLIIGAGAKLANAENEIRELVELLKFPFTPTWGAADIIDHESPYYAGTFGTHGTRAGNFTVQNSDLVISIGSRLDTKATGHPPSTFARGAQKIMVDIDETEINKFKTKDLMIDIGICSDAKQFTLNLLKEIDANKISDVSEWNKKVGEWKRRYNTINENEFDPYSFFASLSNICEPNDNIILDTGCVLAWALQSFKCKEGQILMHDWNNTAMGWGLPASMGAYLANRNRTICISGDGSMQMNIQELATIKRYNLPIKIIVMNNDGHAMIRQTQDQWLNSNYIASSIEGGLPSVNFCSIGKAYGVESVRYNLDEELPNKIRKFLSSEGAALCEILVDASYRVKTQVKFGRPLEDLEPLLPRKEFFNNMIVKPI